MPETTTRPDARLRLARAAAVSLGLVAMLGYLGVRGLKGLRNPYADFYDFFHAAAAFRAGTDLYTSGDNGYIYPPLLAFLLQPLTALGERGAGVAWIALMLAGTALATVLAAGTSVRTLAPEDPRARDWTSRLAPGVLALLVLLTTFKREFDWANCNVLVILALVLAAAWMERRAFLAGFLLGFAVHIKYLPIVFLPYFLVRRRWGAAGGMVAGLVVFALLPAAGSGWGGNLHDLGVAHRGMAAMLGVEVEGPAANVVPIEAEYSMSWTSSCVRMAIALGVDRTWAFVAAAGGAVVMAAAAWGLYALAREPFWRVGARTGARGRVVVHLELAGLVVAMLLFGPQTLLRHLNMLLPVVACALALALFGAGRGMRAIAWLAIGLLVLGAVHMPAPDLWRETVTAWRAYGGISVSIGVFYLLILHAGLRHARALDRAAISAPSSSPSDGCARSG